jgi:uncharacterized protein (DUF1501 family)
MKRRDFVKLLPMGLGAAASLPFLNDRAAAMHGSKLLDALANPTAESDKILVIIFLEGGNDGLNTLIPFRDPTYDKFRQNTGFVTNEEKQRLTRKLSDTLAFNPHMASLADLWDDGKVAVVQNIGVTNPNLSHFRATDVWNSACDHDQFLDTGWIGRWSELENPLYPVSKPKDPLAIAMGSTGSLFQGRRSSVEVLVKDPSHYSPIGASETISTIDTLGGEELTFVRQLVGISDFYGRRFSELFPKYAKNTVDYPETYLGDQMKQIAWCIGSGMKTKIYFAQLEGFDTHFNQHSKDIVRYGHGELLKEFSDAVNAFQRDLQGMGAEDRVTTMTYSEFGRRAWENGGHSSGTDHGTAAPHFVIGSQVNGGLYGHDPDLETLDENGDPFLEFEFRQMYASVMGDWFGVSKETCTAVLSPGRDRAPFETEFPLNDGSGKRSLIRKSTGAVAAHSTSDGFRLKGNYPNPANAYTKIHFDLDRTENVKLQIFDRKGSLITTMLNTRLGQGEHTPELRTAELPSGSYVYRLTVGERFETRRLNIIH